MTPSKTTAPRLREGHRPLSDGGEPDFPVGASGTWVDAWNTAVALVDAEKTGVLARNNPWGMRCVTALACSLLAANLDRRDYETALEWALRWDDPRFLDIDRILREHDEEWASDSWVSLRRVALRSSLNNSWSVLKDTGTYKTSHVDLRSLIEFHITKLRRTQISESPRVIE
jgi:hypothetical protein